MAVNGHIRPEPGQTYPYENPPLLWRGLGNGRFVNVSATAGPAIAVASMQPARIAP